MNNDLIICYGDLDYDFCPLYGAFLREEAEREGIDIEEQKGEEE